MMDNENVTRWTNVILSVAVVFILLPLLVFGLLDPKLLAPRWLQESILHWIPSVAKNYENFKIGAPLGWADSYLRASSAIVFSQLLTVLASGTAIFFTQPSRSHFDKVTRHPSTYLKERWRFVMLPEVSKRFAWLAIISAGLVTLTVSGFIPIPTDATTRPNRFVAGAVLEIWTPTALLSMTILAFWAGLVTDFGRWKTNLDLEI